MNKNRNQNFWRQADARDYLGEKLWPQDQYSTHSAVQRMVQSAAPVARTDWKLISNDVSIALAGGRRMEEQQVIRMFRDAANAANPPVIVR